MSHNHVSCLSTVALRTGLSGTRTTTDTTTAGKSVPIGFTRGARGARQHVPQVAKLGVRELLCIRGGLIAAERLAAVEVSLPRSGLPLWPLQHSFVRKTAFQTANRPHRKAAAPRRESAASLAAPRHVSVTVVKLSQLVLVQSCAHIKVLSPAGGVCRARDANKHANKPFANTGVYEHDT